MPEVKFDHVVSFSSEDPPFKAENLTGKSKNGKWRCANAGESQASVVLQAKSPFKIGSVDIGNWGSAFIEVMVRRQESPDSDFQVLLPAASFQSPLESRNEQNAARVRIFQGDKLTASVADQKWDQFKIVCSQPFNKHIKYGLSFFNVTSATEEKAKSPPRTTKLGAFVLKAEQPDEEQEPPKVGGLFESFKKASKPSVAAEMKSDETLAAMTVKASGLTGEDSGFESNKKKRKADEKVATREPPKKPRNGGNLPRRDVAVPGETADPKPLKTPKESTSNVVKKTKPFERLFEDVKFVLSGFQNPLRGEIRDKALQMGAKYRGDWDSSCTHLVCAFSNTPKFNQVRKQRGSKIVKSGWIERSFIDKIRYPWRRYCLDPSDSAQDESEDELWDESLVKETPKVVKEEVIDTDDEKQSYEADTDDELDRVKAEREVKKVENSDDAYDADTDVDEGNESSQQSEDALDLKSSNVLLYGPFDDRDSFMQIVSRFTAKTLPFINSEVNIIVTDVESWDRNFDLALKTNPNLKFLRGEFFRKLAVKKCGLESIESHLIVK